MTIRLSPTPSPSLSQLKYRVAGGAGPAPASLDPCFNALLYQHLGVHRIGVPDPDEYLIVYRGRVVSEPGSCRTRIF